MWLQTYLVSIQKPLYLSLQLVPVSNWNRAQRSHLAQFDPLRGDAYLGSKYAADLSNTTGIVSREDELRVGGKKPPLFCEQPNFNSGVKMPCRPIDMCSPGHKYWPGCICGKTTLPPGQRLSRNKLELACDARPS